MVVIATITIVRLGLVTNKHNVFFGPHLGFPDFDSLVGPKRGPFLGPTTSGPNQMQNKDSAAGQTFPNVV